MRSGPNDKPFSIAPHLYVRPNPSPFTGSVSFTTATGDTTKVFRTGDLATSATRKISSAFIPKAKCMKAGAAGTMAACRATSASGTIFLARKTRTTGIGLGYRVRVKV